MVILIIAVTLFAGGSGYLKLKANKSHDVVFQYQEKYDSLRTCGEKPRCVSSFSKGDMYISPMTTKLTLDQVRDQLTKGMDLKLNKQMQNYLHFTYESSFFGFIDDVEILYLDKQLYFRSESRVGYSDLGANRSRVKEIKEALNR